MIKSSSYRDTINRLRQKCRSSDALDVLYTYQIPSTVQPRLGSESWLIAHSDHKKNLPGHRSTDLWRHGWN